MVTLARSSGSTAIRFSSTLEVAIMIAMFVAAVTYGKSILQPLAFATLLCFILAPFVRRLERLRVPRVAAVLLVAASTFAAIGSVGWLVTDQCIEMSENFSNYKGTLIDRIRSLKGAAEQSLGHMSKTLGDLNRELSNQGIADKKNEPSPKTDGPNPPSQGNRSLTAGMSLWSLLTGGDLDQSRSDSGSEQPSIQIVTAPSSPLAKLQNWLGPLLGPLAAVGLVVVLLIFMLLQHEDLRNRLIRLIGTEHLLTTTEALDETSSRLGNYLRMQLLVNILFGIAIAIGLSLVGLPGALLWGMLATLFRFLPYIGPWMAGAFPLILSLAVFEGWAGPGLVLSVFLVLELLSNNVLEPWLYGTTAGISSFGVIVAALFWTWMWGPLGLIFAMPFTVCLVVLGKHSPAFSFVNILVGDSDSLSNAERLYQRLLAFDRDEADRLIAKHGEPENATAKVDKMIFPVLSLIERDWHAGSLDQTLRLGLLQSLQDIVNSDDQVPTPALVPGVVPDEGSSVPRTILCVPAHDEADELAARICVADLMQAGMHATNLTVASLVAEIVARIDEVRPDVVLISTVPPQEIHHARYLCKKIRQRFPRVPVIVGLWQSRSASVELQKQFIDAGATKLVCGLAELRTAAQSISLDGAWLPVESAHPPVGRQLAKASAAQTVSSPL